MIEIRTIRRHPRERWADDAQCLAAQGGDALVWPEVTHESDDMNAHLCTVTVAPMTTGSRPARVRVALSFQGKQGLIVLDQIQTLDRVRLVKRQGAVRLATLASALQTLQAMFAP